MERTQFEKLVADVRIVPVVVIKELQDTIPTLSALRDGEFPLQKSPSAPLAQRMPLRSAQKPSPT